MRSFRFLLSRRWVLFALAVVTVVVGTWWLGQWQFHRLDDRQAGNDVIRQNEGRAPAPVAEVLTPGRDVATDDEWRLVTATGEYAVDDTIVVRYRTRDGVAGIDVVVPLVTADGTALLVDRGWLRTDNRGVRTDDLPEPPAGEVTVTGYVRANGSGDSTAVVDRATRAIDSTEVAAAIDRDVYGGFVKLDSEDPEPETALAPVVLPELNDGPHFFYGLQWWFFGVLAVGGFLYLAYDEWRGGGAKRRERSRQRAERRARINAKNQQRRDLVASARSAEDRD